MHKTRESKRSSNLVVCLLFLPSVDPKFVDDYIDLFDGNVFAGALMSIRPFWRRTSFEADDLPPNGDIFEIALLKQSVEKGKAILGICRGMQPDQCSFRWDVVSRSFRGIKISMLAFTRCAWQLSVSSCKCDHR